MSPKKTFKMRPLNNIPQFDSPNHFDTLQISADDNDNINDNNICKTHSRKNPLGK